MSCIGKVLGNRYEILEEIGSGGMATVYKARCKLLNRFVAVKVLRDEFANDSEFIKRFQVEAQSAASLSHPNIVSIYDVGFEDGMHYIVMELIEGKTLKEIIQEKGKLEWKEANKIASQIASGLIQAHQNHIVHRDIKPHNIIMTKDGTAKVTDFGIAKAVSNSTINAFGSTIGSVHYFSPEHARGGYTDEKSDIYSLGVVLYEMCTGKLPFEGETPVAVALKHLQEEIIEPISLCHTLPIGMNDIIKKAMMKDTNERYASASEMYKDLQNVLNNPSFGVSKDENKTNYEFPTQKIPVIGVQNDKKIEAISEKINKYKNEQDDDFMSSKRKITKPMAIIRLIFVLAAIALLFLGCVKLGGFITTEILGAPKEVEVPNLIGYSVEEAERLLEEKGLELGKETQIINNEYPKGYIVEQQYPEGYSLKIGAEVNIKTSKGQKTVLVPDVSNVSRVDLAKTMIETAGLVFKEEKEFSNTIEEGTIIRQEPLVNEEVPEGSTVTVYISAGPDNTGLVKVPELVGKTEKEARELLDNAKFVANVQYQSNTSKENGIVLDQTPEAGTYESELTEVIIVVNKLLNAENPPEVTPTPNGNNNNDNNNNNNNVIEGKKSVKIDLSNKGERDTFVVKVILEGQTIGRKVEYEANHKRTDGTVTVLVSDIKGAMLKVYIDDKVVSEVVL